MDFHETSMAFSEHVFLLFIQFLWSDNFIRIIPQQVCNKKLEEILTHLFASTFGHELVSSTYHFIRVAYFNFFDNILAALLEETLGEPLS